MQDRAFIGMQGRSDGLAMLSWCNKPRHPRRRVTLCASFLGTSRGERATVFLILWNTPRPQGTENESSAEVGMNSCFPVTTGPVWAGQRRRASHRSSPLWAPTRVCQTGDQRPAAATPESRDAAVSGTSAHGEAGVAACKTCGSGRLGTIHLAAADATWRRQASLTDEGAVVAAPHRSVAGGSGRI